MLVYPSVHIGFLRFFYGKLVGKYTSPMEHMDIWIEGILQFARCLHWHSGTPTVMVQWKMVVLLEIHPVFTETMIMGGRV